MGVKVKTVIPCVCSAHSNMAVATLSDRATSQLAGRTHAKGDTEKRKRKSRTNREGKVI